MHASNDKSAVLIVFFFKLILKSSHTEYDLIALAFKKQSFLNSAHILGDNKTLYSLLLQSQKFSYTI